MDKKQPSILKQKVRVPLQEVMLPDFPDDETVTTTVTRSRRVSFGTNFVKEFIVGSAVSTQCVSEYEHALSSSDSSRSVTQSHLFEQSTFSAQENIRLSTEGGALNLSMNKSHSENVSVSLKGNADNRYDFEVDKKQLNIMKQSKNLTDLHLGPEKIKYDELNRPNIEKKTKCGKFSSTICFSADSPTADMEFTEGCINLAKSILDKKKKAITVFIQAKPKETKPEGNETFVFETSDAEMSITKCVEPVDKVNKSVMDVDDFSEDSDMDDTDVGAPFLPGTVNFDDLEESNGGMLKAAFEIDPDTEKSLFSPKKKLNDIFNFSADESMIENMSLDESQIAHNGEATFCPQSEGMELTKCVKLVGEPEKIPESLQTSAMDFTKCVKDVDSPLGSDMMEETPCKKFPLNRSHVSFAKDESSSDDSMDVTGCLNVPSSQDVNKLFSIPAEKGDSLDDLTNNSGKADSVERFVGACFTGDNNNKNESFLDSSLSEKEDKSSDSLATPLETSLNKNDFDDSGMDITEAITNEAENFKGEEAEKSSSPEMSEEESEKLSSPVKFSAEEEDISSAEKFPEAETFPVPEKVPLPEKTIEQLQLSEINEPVLLNLIEKPEAEKICTPEKTIPIEKSEEDLCNSNISDEFETSDANKENQDPVLKLTIDSPEHTFMRTLPEIAPPEEDALENVSGDGNVEVKSPEKAEKDKSFEKISPEKNGSSLTDRNEGEDEKLETSGNETSGIEMTPNVSALDEAEKKEEIVEEKMQESLNVSSRKSSAQFEEYLNASGKTAETSFEKSPEILQEEKIEEVKDGNRADESLNMSLENVRISPEKLKNVLKTPEKPRVSLTELQKSFDKFPASPEKVTAEERNSEPDLPLVKDSNTFNRSVTETRKSPEKPLPSPEKLNVTVPLQQIDAEMALDASINPGKIAEAVSETRKSPEKQLLPETLNFTASLPQTDVEMALDASINAEKIAEVAKRASETRKSPEKPLPSPEKLNVTVSLPQTDTEMDVDASINAGKIAEADPKENSRSMININSNTIILHNETPVNDRTAATFTVTPKNMTYVVPNSTYVLDEEQPPAESPVKVEIPKDEKYPQSPKSPEKPEMVTPKKLDTPEKMLSPEKPQLPVKPSVKRASVELSPLPESHHKKHRLSSEFVETGIRLVTDISFNLMDDVTLGEMDENKEATNTGNFNGNGSGAGNVIYAGNLSDVGNGSRAGNVIGAANESYAGNLSGAGNAIGAGNVIDAGNGNGAENGSDAGNRDGDEKMETTTDNLSENNSSNDEEMEIDSNSKSLMVEPTCSVGDGKIMSLLTEQAKETNCLWKIKELKDDSWSFTFKIQSSVAVVDFKLKSTDGKDSYSLVTDKRINLTHENEYLTSKPLSVIEFGFVRMKKFFDDEKKIESVRHIPYTLDLINSFSSKINNYLNQILTILEQYPGSELKDDTLTFRLFSFPVLFSCNVVIDLKNLSRLSRDCLSFENHFGNLDKNQIKDVFEESLKCENSLVEFIISSTKYAIRLELEKGRLSKRDHIQLLPDYLKEL